MRGTRLWLGNESNPDDRKQIVVSRADLARIPPRGDASGSEVDVTDLLTGATLRLTRIACGAGEHCRCALGEVVTPAAGQASPPGDGS